LPGRGGRFDWGSSQPASLQSLSGRLVALVS